MFIAICFVVTSGFKYMYLKYLFYQSIHVYVKHIAVPEYSMSDLGFFLVFGGFFAGNTNNFIFGLSVLDVRFYPAKHFGSIF